MLLTRKGVIEMGHFKYPSGRHGSDNVDNKKIFRDPELVNLLATEIAAGFHQRGIDLVVARELFPALLGFSVARVLGKQFIPTLSSAGSTYGLGNGDSAFVRGKRVLVIEDIVDRGMVAKSMVNMLGRLKANVVGMGAICNRGANNPQSDGLVPKFSALTQLSHETWDALVCKTRGPCSCGAVARMVKR
jgi:orotate phosphoribosyltransferase